MGFHKIQESWYFHSLVLEFVIISRCLWKGKLAQEFKIDLILNELKEKFMKSISQRIDKNKLFSPPLVSNLFDSWIVLREGEFLKLSESDIWFGINLKIIKDKPFFLLTATQLHTSEVIDKLYLGLSICVHFILQIKDTFGHKVWICCQHLTAVFQLALIITYLVQVSCHTLRLHRVS